LFLSLLRPQRYSRSKSATNDLLFFRCIISGFFPLATFRYFSHCGHVRYFIFSRNHR